MHRPLRQVRWIGGPTLELKLGAWTFLSDPMFSSGPSAFIMNGHPSTGEDGARIARAGEVPGVDVAAVDAVIVSHLHSDHFDQEAREKLPKDLLILAPAVQVDKLREWGFHNVRPMDWWEQHSFHRGVDRVDVLAVPARHSADEKANEMLGVVNGHLITHRSNGKAFHIYWTGDTVWFDGMREIRKRAGAPDLVVPHVGAVGRDGPWGRMTLDAGEALQLLDLFAPATMIPIHHHTYSHYVEPVEALVDLVAKSDAEARLRVLREGQHAAF